MLIMSRINKDDDLKEDSKEDETRDRLKGLWILDFGFWISFVCLFVFFTSSR